MQRQIAIQINMLPLVKMNQTKSKHKSLYSRVNFLLYNNLLLVLVICACALTLIVLLLTKSKVNRSLDEGNNTTYVSNAPQADQLKIDAVPKVTTPSSSSNSVQNNTKTNSNYQATTTSTPSASKYTAPLCTKTPTPYKTFIQLAPYLGTTTTKIDGGVEGYTETCTADNNGYTPYPVPLNPVNKYIYVGTGGISASTPPRTHPPDSDQLDRIKIDCSVQLSTHGNQDAYQLCVSTLSRYFNIP